MMMMMIIIIILIVPSITITMVVVVIVIVTVQRPTPTGCRLLKPDINILAIFYPPLKYIRGCVWLFLQAQKGTIYFTELAERVEYGNYD